MNKPRTRFAKYTNEWVNVKLGDVGSLRSGYGFPEDEQGGTAGIPFFKVGDMIENERVMKHANHYVTDEQIKANHWKVFEPTNGAVIFAKVGGAVLKDRKRYVDQPFLIDNNLMAYMFDDSWDPTFGFALFNTLKLPRYAQTGALPSFNLSDINTIKVNVPSKSEQHEIGNFFRNLDEQIDLQADRLARLKEQKHGYLQKMFIQ